MMNKTLRFLSKSTLIAMACFLTFSGLSQLNIEYKSHVEYDVSLNDVWGWSDGVKEYGLVGLRNGVSIVDVTDTENATELFYIPGIESTWRDIKTWDSFAYVSNESGDGLMVIDMTNLPDEIDYYLWEPTIQEMGGQLSTIHNLWMDENGILYLIGSNWNGGGLVYIDCFTDPWNPEYIDHGSDTYSHDAYVRDNVSYCCEIYDGGFSIYNISEDFGTTSLQGFQQTEGTFTHNCWLSDDSSILYTTDEVGGAPVGAYNVEDPSNIIELDQFQPYATLGDGVIPHNVHVWEDWLIVSYYTDGCILVDGSVPTNMIEVGNFDTFIPQTTGFSGAWGAYPYLPSETVLVSDIGNGLYVLEPNYVNACWLEGNVTEAGTGIVLSAVEVEILQTTTFDNTDIAGDYATGYAVPGDYTIKFSKAGYETLEVVTNLDNGVTTVLDVELVSLVPFTISGIVYEEGTTNPIPDADVLIYNDEFEFETVSDGEGNFTIPNFFAGNYEVIAGKWGWITECQDASFSMDENTYTIELSEGWYDDFTFDFGWNESGSAATGGWEIGIPQATQIQGTASNPGEDVNADCFLNAYVTGNDGGGAGDDDVDDGNVVLESPEFPGDLGPQVNLSWWFTNWDNTEANDEFTISVSDGTNEAEMLSVDANGAIAQWNQAQFNIYDFLDPADNYTIIIETGDDVENGSIVEAAIDHFWIEYLITDIDEDNMADVTMYPNPSNGMFNLNIPENLIGNYVIIRDVHGKMVSQLMISNTIMQVEPDVADGLYFVEISNGSTTLWRENLILQK